MIKTYGTMPKTLPAGMFKAVRFPNLASVDKTTSDHRRLLSEGFNGPRNIPMTIKMGVAGGHFDAVISGALHEVTLDPESGVLSGRGFLLNDENGRRHARMIHTKAMDRNSVELADVKARFVEDMDKDEYWIEFYEWALGATCGVAVPAFAEAHIEVDPLSDDELTAAYGDPMEELVADCPTEIRLPKPAPEGLELTASTILAPFDAFFTPEADKPTKFHVDDKGWGAGHLAVWNTCHDGVDVKCIMVPRPVDSYASFNKPGILTERGVIEAGPIFALGGHRSLLGGKDTADAYGGIENAWCDVRVIPGKFGPWASGYVRPGVPDEVVYAARASRISGHWLGNKLKAIVSVNAEGYDVPGSGELAASFEFALGDDGVSELVASFPDCLDGAPDPDGTDIVLHLKVGALTPDEITAAVVSQLGLTPTGAVAMLESLVLEQLADEPDLPVVDEL